MGYRKLIGDLQENGDFIFSFVVQMYNSRRMVRTSNNGVFIKSGNRELGSTDWNDSSKWYKGSYRVTHFTGSRGKNISLVHGMADVVVYLCRPFVVAFKTSSCS